MEYNNNNNNNSKKEAIANNLHPVVFKDL